MPVATINDQTFYKVALSNYFLAIAMFRGCHPLAMGRWNE
ncbi:hypothetical protein A464_4296 [Salmonella bongori N268-08]|uniref:Uncharacterized protein n=1 Tax=Salmonella bongori N268-08 TaxID=1197719 RepID=S5N360_SALBN|nr:hypothetical protein A464_4296 [Salmonella bongori N268-08]